MNSTIIDFLNNHRLSVLSVLRADGSPHSATLHYSFSQEPFELYFSTDRTSRKCEALHAGNSVKASVVIGFSEDEWLTFQLNGDAIAISDAEELAKVQTTHYARHPNSEKFKNDPDTIFLKFTPTWWRYSDLNPDSFITYESE